MNLDNETEYQLYLKYIKKISKYNLSEFNNFYLDINKNKYISKVHFEGFDNFDNINEIKRYKKSFFRKNNNKIKKLNYLYDNISIKRDKNLIKLLKSQILMLIDKYNFILKTFDIEAFKMNSSYNIKNNKIDINYDYYSNSLYNVKKNNFKKVKKNNLLMKGNSSYKKFSKLEYLEILKEISKLVNDDITFDISDKNINLAHNKGTIKIPNREEYSIREIITLCFHEMTHYFRYKNMQINLGGKYTPYDYYEFEEGLAIYFEYLYGDKIINIGEYTPLYDILYNILLFSKRKDKKALFIKTAQDIKLLSQDSASKLYLRFHRYSFENTDNLFLKEGIYKSSYYLIKKILNKKIYSIDELMSFKNGRKSIKLLKYINPINNYDFIKYFDSIEKILKDKL